MYEEAYKFLRRAIAIRRFLAQTQPEEFEHLIADSLQSLDHILVTKKVWHVRTTQWNIAGNTREIIQERSVNLLR